MDQRFNPAISPSIMGNGVIDLDDDDDFLAMAAAAAAAAEAAAVESRTKRQKLSTLAAVGGGGGSSEDVPEGPYMAALRGSRSNLWKQQQEQRKKGAFAPLGQANNSSANTGSCFKCGMPGHWSRDCTNVDGTGGSGGGGGGGAEGDVAEKPCPCGLGSCLVLTSNTAKNPGRKFYRCPQRPENGGCSFFEWCDSPSAPLPGYSAPRGAPTYEPYSRGAPTYESYPRGAPAYESNSSVSDLQCPCGGGPCLVLTSKTAKNPGRQYYSCPKKEFSLQGKNSCNFFKWCDERTPVANEPSFTLQYNPGSQYSGGTGKECFKRGKEGHWARDCIIPDSNAPSFTSQYNPSIQHSGGTGAPCYKCGKEGHWARNCTMLSLDYSVDARQNKPAASGSGTCFKCGETGHWARDCPGQGSGASGGSRRASDSFANPYSYKSR